MNKKEAKEEIKKIVAKYERLTSGEKKTYNEAMTRKDFILPLFHILGWDVYNDSIPNEVKEEESAMKGTVDYSFRFNNIPQFLLEAKAIKVDLDRAEWAEQAVNYGWNMGIGWVILTDFEGIKLFNASWKIDTPRPSLELTYKEYLDRFDDLWLFSKESFEKGELDKQVEKWSIGAKRVEVTEKLANDLIEWRKELFDNFHQWNSDKSEEEIDEAVQRILDRFIFIRSCEDRKIEPPTLWQNFQKWDQDAKERNFLKVLRPLFKEFDEKYNSNLFVPHFCEELDTEGEPFLKLINGLYGDKESGVKYNFAAIKPDVLGKVYEQYLGHLSQKAGRGGEDLGKTKRKKQGIYYTPTFVVDYIVQNALGPVLDKCKTIHDLKKIRVLDPACGSGSFLVKALEAINDRYKKLGAKGDTFTKIQILTENIYGVDLDEQAVELARLNLLLSVLDGQVKLPLLSNIKNGNSLIYGTDEELEKYFGKNFKDKKPFNWKEEFPEVFRRGGFDVIIGNPPYIKEFVNKAAFDGLHNSPYYQGKMDIWTMFACISIDLLKGGGILSFIAPNNWVSNAGASIFRDKILKDGELKSFVDFGDYKVFEDAGIQTMIFSFEKKKPNKKYTINYLRITDGDIVEDKLISDIHGRKEKISIEPQKLMGENITFEGSAASPILEKMQGKKNFEILDEEISNGIHHHHDRVNKERKEILGKGFSIGDGIFVLSDSEKKQMKFNKKELEIIKPSYTTDQINRWYSESKNKEWVIYTDSSFKDSNKINFYPNIKKHLDKFRAVITSDNKPYGLHRAKKEKFFKGEKIIALRKCLKPSFAHVDFDSYVSATFYIIKSERINQKYLTAILNSKITAFWLKNKGKMQGNNYQLDKGPLIGIPICVGTKEQQNNIITLADKMILLNKEFHEIPENSNKWELIKSEIEKTNKKIDQEIYKLYGLTPEEIRIVENQKRLRVGARFTKKSRRN